MPDLWTLAFLFRGVIAAAGDTMPLGECEERARAMPAAYTHAVCINVQAPTCRVYLTDPALPREASASCRRRAARAAKEGGSNAS